MSIYSIIMKINFLLLSLTLFVTISSADESLAQISVGTVSETAQSVEAEPNNVTEEDLPQSGGEASAVSDDSFPSEAEAAPLVPDSANVSTESAPVEIVPAHPGDAYLELALGLYESCKSLGLILEQVHNMPSADAAAPEVANLTDRILALMRSESMLPPPSLEIQQYVQERTSALNTAEVSEKAIGRVIDLVAKTDPICYGSAALRAELQRLVRGLLGQ